MSKKYSKHSPSLAYSVPFYDLKRTLFRRLNLLYSMNWVVKSGKILLGPSVVNLEGTIANLVGRKFACAVSSGTSAVYLSLKALGIGPGDEVITTPLTWIATTNAITECGAKPIFCDVDFQGNLDPALIRERVTSRTKAILFVNFYGNLSQIDAIEEIGKELQLPIIEDAAQSFGASVEGRYSGSFGTLSAFSFNPVKNLGSLGEAGMVLTDDEYLFQELVSLRYLGMPNKMDCTQISLNHKIDTLQAAVLLTELKYLEGDSQKRLEIARRYSVGLSDSLSKPHFSGLDNQTFFDYCVLSKEREKLIEHLNLCGIETKIRYPKLVFEHEPYKSLGWERLDFPIASRFANESLCLPIYPRMSKYQVESVIKSVNSYF